MTLASPGTILLVEDERVMGRELEQTLTSFGYRVLPRASSCEEALRHAAEGPPDLVIMDVQLQGEQDGIRTAELLRARWDVPVIFLTASTDETTRVRATTTDPDAYLVKPVKTVELRASVEIALHRSRVERQVRERWFATVLRCIGDGVVTTGLDGRVTFMNEVAERLTGWKVEAANGRDLDAVFAVVDERALVRLASPIDAAIRAGEAVHFPGDLVLLRRDGGRVPIDASASPVIDGDGSVGGAVVVFRDASERRELQSNLVVADRMVSIGLLAAGVAHEINTPLATVVANLEMARRTIVALQGASGSSRELGEVVEELGDASEASARIREIVRDLTVFSRSEDGTRGLVDVRRVMESTLRLASNEIRHRARVVKSYGPVPLVEASESRLGQVFLNLVINAAQAIPEGRAEDNELRVSTGTAAEGRAVIEVGDTGVGMPPEVLRRLYQPFFSTKPMGEGTGLGLSICHRIVTELGGTLSIDSVVDRGTVVRVSLPPARVDARSTPAEASVPLEARGRGERRRGKVLVIDDDEMVVRAIRRVLGVDHDVVTMLRADEALEAVTGGACFDVILCDLMMPEMTGMELYRRLQEASPEHARRMVFVTGGVFTQSARGFLDEVPNERIEKPFDLGRILEIVEARVG